MPWFLRMSFLMALLFVTACEQETEPAPVPVVKQSSKASITEASVELPESVKGQWRAVRLSVYDRVAQQESVFTVDIGYGFKLAEGDVTVKVKGFVPAFLIKGRTVTSASNDPSNPAAQIEITDGGKVVFDGWVFALFPATHASTHPRFSVSLVGQIPAKKKVDK